MFFSMNKIRKLSIFSIVMINIIAVCSLRSLPFGAKLGFSLIFYYLVCGIFFFIPITLVVAELATTWPQKGGIYLWVKKAFGPKIGFFVVWLQWLYNIFWYPTILGFISGIFAFLIDSSLLENKIYVVCSVLVLFWVSTFLNFIGIKFSSIVSMIGSFFGTLIPMFFVIIFGFYWKFFLNDFNFNFSMDCFFSCFNYEKIIFIPVIFFSLSGIEISSVHVYEMENPKINFPKSLFISCFLILFLLIFSSLSILFILPENEINIIVGVSQVMKCFLFSVGLSKYLNFIYILLIIGAISCVVTWIIGPTRSILVAAEDGYINSWFTIKNSYNVPVFILFFQAIIVSFLSLFYCLYDSIEYAYFILTFFTSLLALFMYVIVFIAALVLRYKYINIVRPYKIPFGKFGIWFVCSLGFFICLLVIFVSFYLFFFNYTDFFYFFIFFILFIFIFFFFPFVFIVKS